MQHFLHVAVFFETEIAANPRAIALRSKHSTPQANAAKFRVATLRQRKGEHNIIRYIVSFEYFSSNADGIFR